MTRHLGSTLFGCALLAAAAWLVFSIVRLVGSVTTYHQRVIRRPSGVPMPSDSEVNRLLAEQNRWGTIVMFAVAAVAATVLLTIIAWLMGTQRPAGPRMTSAALLDRE